MAITVEEIEQSVYAEATLDQWAMFVAVCDSGGIHAAARQLGRSHSAVSHALSKLQSVLQVDLLQLDGRRSVPTEEGLIVLAHARRLVGRALDLERLAANIQLGWEAELCIVVDGVVPRTWLAEVNAQFDTQAADTRLRFEHQVKGGAAMAAKRADVDLLLTATLPDGVAPDPIGDVHFAPLVATQYLEDMRGSDPEVLLQIVLADTGPDADKERGWLRPGRRWTVPDIATAASLLSAAPSLAVLPVESVEQALSSGQLARLAPADKDLALQVHCVLPKGRASGPGAKLYASLLRERCA